MEIETVNRNLNFYICSILTTLIMIPFPALAQEYEKFNGTIVLGRPTKTSITFNILFKDGSRNDRTPDSAYIEYGTASGIYSTFNPSEEIIKNSPWEFVLDGLQEDTQYFYRVVSTKDGSTTYSEEHDFHTQRSEGSNFVFTVVADSHLGTSNHCNEERYTQALQNADADNPDFHFDLGDTFRVTKINSDDPTQVTYPEVEELSLNQRPFLGIVANSAPLFFIPGNHELEDIFWYTGKANCPPVYATNARKLYYPNPVPDGSFYTGNDIPLDFIDDDGLREDYFSFEWGDALFVCISPWWYTAEGWMDSQDWQWTIGYDQFMWFKETMEASNKKYKFVLAHHILGTTRGGAAWVDMYEWGGYTSLGGKRDKYGWGDNRQPDKFGNNWGSDTIHDIMKAEDTTMFIQGHDHLFAKEEVDDIVYIACPMPGADPGFSAVDNQDDTFDAYLGDVVEVWDQEWTGDIIMDSSGHMKISVTEPGITVDYIRSAINSDKMSDGSRMQNGESVWSFEIGSPETLMGDVDNNGKVDLADIIVSLQIVSSFESISVNLDGDVNQDQRVGLEEAVYAIDAVVNE